MSVKPYMSGLILSPDKDNIFIFNYTCRMSAFNKNIIHYIYGVLKRR